jgi:hypothetical protein
MENLILYLIKSSTLLLLFYATYFLLLKKNTFFTTNRWFLLLGIFCSILLPFLSFQKTVWIEPAISSMSTLNFQEIATNSVTNLPLIVEEAPLISWEMTVGLLYGIGVVLFLTQLLVEFYSLRKIIKNQSKIQQDGFEFIEINEVISPFSFFKKIVYNRSLFLPEELQNIIEHEKIHAKQLHSLDVLIARMYCILWWWNPFVWLYKKAIIQNLEFIADQNALAKAKDKKSYLLTLIKTSTAEKHVAITNHFYQSLIKKRIVMLHTNQSKKHHSWKYFVVLPALAFFMLNYQVEVVAQEKPQEKLVEGKVYSNTEVIIEQNTTESEILEKIADSIAEEENKAVEKDKIISNNTIYSKLISAYSINVVLDNLKIFYKMHFDIDVKFNKITRNKDNEIIAIDVTLTNKKGVSYDYKASSANPIQPFNIFATTGENENQQFGFSTTVDSEQLKQSREVFEQNKMSSNSKQVILSVDEKDGKYKMKSTPESEVFIKEFTLEENAELLNNILIVADGKVISKEDFYKLDPNAIKSVSVVKRGSNKSADYEELFKKYGKSAKNGIIDVKTNNFKENIAKEEQLKEDHLKVLENSTFIINKLSQNEDFDLYKKILQKSGLKFKISGIERNKEGLITAIKIKLEDENNKNKMSANWDTSRNPKGIPDISVGRKNGKLRLSSD